MFKLTLSVFLLGASCIARAQGPAAASTPSSLPSPLPGKGLAQHDFIYAGEAQERKIFIVRGGKVVWSYDDPAGKGEISDLTMLSNGNILFAHQFGVTEITQDKKVVWNYEPPKGYEVHTAVPIGTDRILYIQNGDPALLRVVNIVTNVIEKEMILPVQRPSSTHGQFRHARLTDKGTLLVAHMDLNKVVEYDWNGNELWSFPGVNPWGVSPLPNGNVLITDRQGVREVTRRGDSVWTFNPFTEAAAYHFSSLQLAWRLPNGNTLVNNWVNSWNASAAERQGTIQAIEVTPTKEVVWALASWTPPADLGPATTLQLLDTPSAPEDVHFGPIH